MSFCSVSLFSQSFQDFFSDTTQTLNIYTEGSFNYGVRNVNNEFINQFYFSDNINRKQKDDAYKNLKAKNTFGGDLNLSINAEIPFDTLFGKTNLSMLVGVEMVEHVDGVFTEDLFKFALDGNKQFAGQTANFSGTSFNYFSYQQLNFGFVSYKKNKLKEGIVFSLIKAQEHQAIKAPRANLYTEQFGRELTLDIHYLYNSSDTASKSLSAINGLGISTDLFTQFRLKNGDRIDLSVNDIGFIHWNSNSIHLEADSTFVYDGIEVDNIFDLNDSLISDISQDSILNLVAPNQRKESYAIALPTSFNLVYNKVINEKVGLAAGVNYRILANYFPFFYLNTTYTINPKLLITSQLSYGGYGLFNGGVAVAKSIKDKFKLYVGSYSLFGLIVPQSTYSNNGFVGLKMYF